MAPNNNCKFGKGRRGKKGGQHARMHETTKSTTEKPLSYGPIFQLPIIPFYKYVVVNGC